MKGFTLVPLIFVFVLSSTASASWDEFEDDTSIPTWQEQRKHNQESYRRWQQRFGNPRQLGPITPNAYGPGINSDGTGRPFRWQPDFGTASPNLRVKPNAYGPGVGMDQYGRPVRPRY